MDTNTLVNQAKNGNINARNQLLEENLGLIIYMINKTLNAKDPGPYIYEGTLGFINAIQTYDPDYGVKFQTYAANGIRYHLLGTKRIAIMERREVELAPELVSIPEPNTIDEQIEEGLRILDQFLDTQNDRDIEILKLRLAGEPLKEVGPKFGLSKERTRQLESRAKEKLTRILHDSISF